MGISEVALGVVLPPAIMEILRLRLPKQSIHRLLLAAQLHPPQVALNLGLVDRLSEDPMADAQELATLLSGYNLHAYAATKKMIQGDGVQRALTNLGAIEEILSTWDSPDTRARLLAALGK